LKPRRRVAKEAARLLYTGAAEEYKQAKEEAARSLGVDAMPSNYDVAIELDLLAEETEGEGRRRLLLGMREAALKMMRALAEFDPRLIGSVWRGTGPRGVRPAPHRKRLEGNRQKGERHRHHGLRAAVRGRRGEAEGGRLRRRGRRGGRCLQAGPTEEIPPHHRQAGGRRRSGGGRPSPRGPGEGGAVRDLRRPEAGPKPPRAGKAYEARPPPKIRPPEALEVTRLFGTSGIRGVANREVTPLLASQLGAALASQFDGGAVTVGRDPRLSGEMLEAALVAGIASCGADARTLGVVPTPVLAYLTRELEADAGVATGMAYTEGQERRLEERMEGGELRLSRWDGIGTVEAVEAKWIYVDAIADAVELEWIWKVACDLFNGATCTIAPDVFREVGCRATLINAQPDGHFPAGDPEPTPESLARLGRMVEATGADIGFGFDGDGDRMMPVDERGRTPGPDRVLAAYAGHVVEENRGGVVVTHVGASMCIDEMVSQAGGSVVRTKVGDVSIADRTASYPR